VKAQEYQKAATRTLLSKPDFQITDEQVMLVWNGMGLAGEAGEVAELIKKGVFHQRGIDKEELRRELGDVLWYVAALCEGAGLDLAEVMESNIEKLKLRYPQGYSADDSRARADEQK